MRNKYILFIFFLFILMPGLATAQTKYTTSITYDGYCGEITGHSPIDNYGRKYTVTCHHSDSCRFCVIDHGQFLLSPAVAPPPLVYQAYYASISRDVIVKDIYVVDDYAFFCGIRFPSTTPYSSEAIWGYVEIPAVIAGTASVTVMNVTPWGGNIPPIDLFRIVAYPSTGGSGYDIVSFGVSDNGQYKIVEVVNIVPGSTLSTTCMVADMPFNPYGRLVVDDVVVTDSYVAFSASELNYFASGVQHLWYCYGHKGNVVKDICNSTTSYNYFFPDSWENNNAVAIASLGLDTVALAYTHADQTTGTLTTRIRVVDLGLASNINSQEYVKKEKYDPVRMVYLKDFQSAILLDRVYHSSDFVYLYPFQTTTYTTDCFFMNDNEYTDLRAFGGKYYAASAGSRLYLHDRSALLPLSTPDCPPHDNMNVKVIPNIMPLPVLAATYKKCQTDTIPIPLPTYPFSIHKVDCFSFEF